ncbi:MAG: ComF family protein [Pseudomonadota bacterium]
MQFATKLIDSLFPPRCPVSGDIVDQQGMIAPHIWSNLNFISDPHCEKCGFPFDFDLDDINDGRFCASCLKHPPIFEKSRSALVYDDGSRDILLGFKHGDQIHSVPTMLPWLLRAGQDICNQSDLIVPVPLHYTRLVKRRFNQAGLIAQAISKKIDKPCIIDVLKRDKATMTQGYLNMKERKKNVSGVFSVQQKYLNQIKGKNLLLVDDVYTTGATIEECTKILLKAGVQSVNVLTIARVVKAQKF